MDQLTQNRAVVRPDAGIVLSRSSLLGRPWPDSSLALLAKGYGWLPDRRRRAGGPLVRARLLGQRAVGLTGPAAAEFFYDEANLERNTALPGPVQSTLFGHGPVHTLDGAAHRDRKAMFMDVLTGEGIGDLVARCGAAWDQAARDWAGRDQVVLFDEAAVVLTRGVCAWAGVPLADGRALAADLVAMVDGFATAGPRHWRARRARRRTEDFVQGLVQDTRSGRSTAPPGSALAAVAGHRDRDGRALPPPTAAVEVLNILRPTVAVAWFLAFTGHALARWPQHRDRLAAGDPAFAEAFAQEVRRFYPFAPFVGGRAVRDLRWAGQTIPADALVLLDLYGQNHSEELWPQPYRFDPARFLDRTIGPFELVPQGGGDPRTGHRCPGEQITVALLKDLSVRLARLDYELPAQDLSISLRRVPTRPRSGVRIRVGAGIGRPSPGSERVQFAGGRPATAPREGARWQA